MLFVEKIATFHLEWTSKAEVENISLGTELEKKITYIHIVGIENKTM